MQGERGQCSPCHRAPFLPCSAVQQGGVPGGTVQQLPDAGVGWSGC